MHTLSELYAYNAWANAQVFAICRDIDQAGLETRAPGTYGSVIDTLRHMVQVEFVYALMLQEKPMPSKDERDAFDARDLSQFAEAAARTGAVYAELLDNVSGDWYDEPLHVPWFDFPLTKHGGLLQVLSHSAQHRAQVFSVLGQRGVAVPDLDYVLFVKSKLSGRP